MPDTKRTATGVLGGLAGLVGLSAAAGVLIAATVTPAVAITSTAAERAITMFDNLPSVLEIDKLMLPSNFYYTNPDTGQPELMTKFLEQDRTPVEFDQIAPVMYDALLSSEDPRYYQHGGVDLIGTARALLSNAKGGSSTQGASSISQQYVKNVLIQKCEQGAKTEYEVDKDGNQVLDENKNPVVKVSREQALLDCWTDATTAEGPDGYTRKLQEMRYAISLEQKYSKNDILLGYLNIANWGGVTYGIESAARQYFGTTAANLTVAQAATLAGMVQNPNNYRIDKVDGSIWNADGSQSFNKAPDGIIDEGANLVALDNLVKSGEITEEQKFAAADGYTSTKVRQLYVLSRMLEDGKITREQYVEAAVWPITPNVVKAQTGCANAVGKEYFCQYVKDVLLHDPAFGETDTERYELLQRGGLNVYTTLDPRIQAAAQETMAANAPANPSMPGTKLFPNGGRFGAATVSVEASTGRVLSITQNTKFSEEAALSSNLEYSSLVFAGDETFGTSTGFAAGSTFKLFTLIDWLEKGHSLNENLNGTLHVFKRLKDSCDGDWVNYANDLIKNFAGNRGYMGTPLRFTKDSLNTGYFAMAEKLDLCDIQNAATRMGVTLTNGKHVDMNGLGSIIGSNAVSPLAMAGAYATVANNGTYCQPQVIDRITDADGVELKKPERTCSEVIAPNIAATAAYALKGVMQGGSGAQGNPNDGTVTIGKTGTNEETQTWLIQSNTRVTTATWAGNTFGGGDLFKAGLNNIRFYMSKAIQRTVDQVYPGGQFPEPDKELTKVQMVELPNVLGMTMDAAKAQLEEAGFTVEIGPEVDSNQPAGSVGAQSPGAGEVAGGTTVTISPSNGKAISVPDVSGRSLEDAKRALRQAGFGNVSDGQCTPTKDGSSEPRATGTNPPANSIANRNASISVDYTASNCGGGGRGNNGGGGD